MESSSEMNEKLIRYLIDLGKLKSKKVIEAFRMVPRGLFVKQEYLDKAYLDEPLPIIQGATIPQPSIMATLLEELDLKEGEKVLEIGTGSGWSSSLISYCVGKKGMVVSIEGDMFIAEFAKKNIAKLDWINNIKIIIADGSGGYERMSPYDKILYGIAMPALPINVMKQIKVGGIIIAPIGSKEVQILKKIEREKSDKYKEKDIEKVVFSPAYGKFGFNEL